MFDYIKRRDKINQAEGERGNGMDHTKMHYYFDMTKDGWTDIRF